MEHPLPPAIPDLGRVLDPGMWDTLGTQIWGCLLAMAVNSTPSPTVTRGWVWLGNQYELAELFGSSLALSRKIRDKLISEGLIFMQPHKAQGPNGGSTKSEFYLTYSPLLGLPDKTTSNSLAKTRQVTISPVGSPQVNSHPVGTRQVTISPVRLEALQAIENEPVCEENGDVWPTGHFSTGRDSTHPVVVGIDIYKEATTGQVAISPVDTPQVNKEPIGSPQVAISPVGLHQKVTAALAAIDWVGKHPDADPQVIIAIAEYLRNNPEQANNPAKMLRTVTRGADKGRIYVEDKQLTLGGAGRGQPPVSGGTQREADTCEVMPYKEWVQACCDSEEWTNDVLAEAKVIAGREGIGTKGFMLLVRTVAAAHKKGTTASVESVARIREPNLF